jgi:hypothetical protein
MPEDDWLIYLIDFFTISLNEEFSKCQICDFFCQNGMKILKRFSTAGILQSAS